MSSGELINFNDADDLMCPEKIERQVATALSNPGAVVYGPRNIAHTFKNCSDRKARMMALVTPAAAEGFFRGFGEPLPGTSLPPSEEVMIERIMKLAPQYGIEILGPSPL